MSETDTFVVIPGVVTPAGHGLLSSLHIVNV